MNISREKLSKDVEFGAVINELPEDLRLDGHPLKDGERLYEVSIIGQHDKLRLRVTMKSFIAMTPEAAKNPKGALASSMDMIHNAIYSQMEKQIEGMLDVIENYEEEEE